MRFFRLASLALATLGRAGTHKKVCNPFSFDLADASNTDWMAAIPDEVPMSALSIPGTDNSMTAILDNSYLECQNTELDQQLKAGIRYIDVSARRKDDKLEVYHGIIGTRHDMSQVFATVFDFLDSHPSEVILMRITRENMRSGNDKSFEQAMTQYLKSDSGLGQRAKDRVHSFDKSSKFLAPSLGELRGKVLILQDFTTKTRGAFGIPWACKSCLSVSEWKFVPGGLGIVAKWLNIELALKAASDTKTKKLHITYTGAGINGRLAMYMEDKKDVRMGVVVMGFPGKKLVEKIIQRNDLLRPEGSAEDELDTMSK
ncbi:hypothetical protein BROUX41_002146 [Berkeleyomyces rouxiae]